MVVINDWKLGRIGDEILALEAGVSVNSDVNENGANYYILKTSAVSRGQVDLNEVKIVVPREIPRLKCSLTANSILISRMNTPKLVGECGYVENDNDKIFLPDRIWQTVLKQGSQLNCKWLSYVLNTDQLRQYIKNAATGTSNSMKNISKDQILNIKIYFPEPDEQAAIAEALSDADSLIASLEKLIAKKKAIKQGAMQELLTGKKRLPGFSGEWVEKPCTELGSFFKGKGISMQDTCETGYPCIMYGEIYVKFDTHFKHTDHFISNETARNSTLARKEDLFFTASGETAEEIGKCVSYQGDNNIYVGGDIIAMTPNDDVDSLYLAYAQNSDYLLKQKATLAQGHTVVHIGLKHVKDLLVKLPPSLNEQTAIASILSDMDAEIEQLEKKLTKYRLIKQGMMQELLTGRIRLLGEDKKAKSAPKGQDQHHADAIAISAAATNQAIHESKELFG